MTQPYLSLDDVELANALRTFTYLRRGLAGPEHSIGTDLSAVIPPVCHDEVIGDIYPHVYPSPDIYPGSTETICDPVDPYDTRFLACYCAAIDTGPYVDPATDNAPWYSSFRPESAEFLGFVLDSINLRPTLSRGVNQGQRGGTLGLARIGGFIVAVSGFMYAASPAGMEYGERWLEQRLSGVDTAPTLRLLPACADIGGTARFRSLPRVGLIDGPVIQELSGIADCAIQQVTFQLASESPWLLSDAATLLDSDGAFLGNSILLAIPPAEGPGDTGLRIRFHATSTMGNVVFTLSQPVSGSCSEVNPPVIWSASVSSLAVGYEVEIDANDELAQVRHLTDDSVLCGLDCFHYTAPWSWPVVPEGETGCLLISGDIGNGYFTIERRVREL